LIITGLGAAFAVAIIEAVENQDIWQEIGWSTAEAYQELSNIFHLTAVPGKTFLINVITDKECIYNNKIYLKVMLAMFSAPLLGKE